MLGVPVLKAESGGGNLTDGFYVQGIYAPYQERARACDDIGCSTFDSGYSGGGALGYQHGPFRVEFEYNVFSNDFDESTFADPAVVPRTQKSIQRAYVDGRSLMVNAYYDFQINDRWMPYLGAGIGSYEANIKNLQPPAFGPFVANATSSDRFAYQFRAGVTYVINPAFSVFSGYRYFKGDRFEYPIENSDLVIRPNGLESHAVELGVRLKF
jgi:opacity protein-like surface antigen